MRNTSIDVGLLPLISLALCLIVSPPALCADTVLANEDIELVLGVSKAGRPIIKKCAWAKSEVSIFDRQVGNETLRPWVPKPFDSRKASNSNWVVTQTPVFHRAEATRVIGGGLEMTWIVELVRKGSTFRTYVRTMNPHKEDERKVDWFPIYGDFWTLPGGIPRVCWWKSLSFEPVTMQMTAGRDVTLSSRLHSSDTKEGGVNPFWIVENSSGKLFFGLEWCGGWRADLKGIRNGLSLVVFLPPEETQIILGPKESIQGPILNVVPTANTEDALARADWMMQRMTLRRDLYPAPLPSYPLSYNHWYSIRFDVDGDYLTQQARMIPDFGFDAFVVDAGWYEHVGKWVPDSDKFKEGELQSIHKTVSAQGVRPGIWTCPQFIHAEKDHLPPTIDQPAYYEKFIDGYLLDLYGADYSRFLQNHVNSLKDRFHIGWWKYDQLLFTPQSNAGVMKNVIAFQDALESVRQANPDLIIENCQSGGRMINELTLLACDTQWLRDGGHNGLEHARQNIQVALGALEFVFPWSASRWTNNLSRMDTNDEELIRFYCRSAMPGTWGIVDNLPELSTNTKNIILDEIQNYRRLNEIKKDYLYDILPPEDGTDTSGIVFYAKDQESAAVLFFRWDKQGLIDKEIVLPYLSANETYAIERIDDNKTETVNGKTLTEQGIRITLAPEQRSALCFLKATP